MRISSNNKPQVAYCVTDWSDRQGSALCIPTVTYGQML